MREEDVNLLLLPELSQEVNEAISLLKLKYSKWILVSLLVSKFTLMLSLYIMQNHNQKHVDELSNVDQNLSFIVEFIFANLFCQITIGFLTDLISVQASQIFTWCITILSFVLHLVQLDSGNDHLELLGSIIVKCAYCCQYISGSFIIYNTSYALQVRFNHGALFVVIGTYLPQFIFLIVNLCVPQITLSIFFEVTALSICLAFNIICGIIVYLAYKQIENIKKNEREYQIFLRHQGVGLGLMSIGYYYLNENMAFLMIQTLIGCLIGSNQPSQLKDILVNRQGDLIVNDQIYEFFLNSSKLGCLVLTYPILRIINSSQKFIETQFTSLKQFLSISFVVFAIYTIVLSLSQFIPFYCLLVLFQLLILFQGFMRLKFHLISFQINFCLQDEKCSIKCIGLGLLGFLQDLPEFIQIIPANIITSYSIQTGIIFLTLIYNKWFLRDKEFDELEGIIQSQYIFPKRKQEQLQICEFPQQEINQISS